MADGTAQTPATRFGRAVAVSKIDGAGTAPTPATAAGVAVT
jgi:hypothetical protein